MRCTGAAVAAMLFLAGAARAQLPPALGATGGQADAPIDLAAAATVFAEARAALAADAGALWGVDLSGPLLLVDPATRFVVANVPDPEGLLEPHEGVYTGTLPERESIANTSYEWAGVRWAMFLWPLPEERAERLRILAHESFHRIQPELGLPGANPANAHLDSEKGRAWLRLEWRALATALRTGAQERRRAVRDALLFRARRRALATAAAAEERALELNEGLAEYTGYRLSGLQGAELAAAVARRLQRQETSESFARSFAYTSGPAYGLLLDETDPDWRREVTARTDLGELLAAALSVSLPGTEGALAAAAQERAASYDGAEVFADEAERAAARAARLARLRARFVEGPVLVLPVGMQLNFSFDPRSAESLGDLGTVYRTLRISEAWGILEVDGGALMTRREDGNFRDVRVPAPPLPVAAAPEAGRPDRSSPPRSAPVPGPASLEGDGWRLTLKEGWQVVPADRPGDLRVEREQEPAETPPGTAGEATGGVAPATPSRGVTARGSTPTPQVAFAPEVLVSDHDSGGALRVEPAALLAGDTAIVAWNDSRAGREFGVRTGVQVAWAISRDRGRSFRFGGYLPTESEVEEPSAADPWLIATPEGDLLLQILHWGEGVQEVLLYAMRPGVDTTFARRGEIGDARMDKPVLAPLSHGSLGLVYAAARDIRFARSDSGGLQWERPRTLSAGGRRLRADAACAACGPVVLVAWFEGDGIELDELWAAHSFDGGRTFAPAYKARDLPAAVSPPPGYALGVGPAGFIGNHLSMACAPEGGGASEEASDDAAPAARFALAYGEGRRDGAAVVYQAVRVEPGGARWDAPRVLAGGEGRWAVMPSLARFADGIVGVLYYRGVAGAEGQAPMEVFLSLGTGDAFAEFRVSSAASDWMRLPGDPEHAPVQRNVGDYITLAADGTRGLATWTDGRTGASRIMARAFRVTGPGAAPRR